MDMQSAIQGCMLGMAVGDAMGAGVDNKSLQDIYEAYGPDGLLGYDLANGFAEVSSYTQVAAFAVNGLLVAMSRGQLRMPFAPSVATGLKEWARSQYFPGETERRSCWLCRESHMRRRKSMDAWTLDSLIRDVIGSPEKPANNADGPGTLPAAVAAGLLFAPERMEVEEVGALGAQIVALTHGNPTAFLSGAALAYMIAGILQDPKSPLKEHFNNAADAVGAQFAAFPQAAALRKKLREMVQAGCEGKGDPSAFMEELGCMTAARVLCGAVYACLACEEDFDQAMILAINHSGRSAAVGAVTGAILGARLGLDALPGFYLESLDAGQVLLELSADLASSTPGKLTRRLFDDDWDRKYTQGLPVDRHGWSTAD